MSSKLIKAACGDHAIEVEAFDKDFIWLALWSPVGARDWGRFRKAWDVLRGRYGFDNDCILDRPAANELCRALMDAATACQFGETEN